MMEYLVIKSFHIISVVAWMAGLFYLPRLFVYHTYAHIGSELSETLKIMEQRLYFMIMWPSLVASWLFGIWLTIMVPEYLYEPWFIVKAIFVLALSIMHLIMGRWRLAFAKDINTHTHKYFRVNNELPTVALIVIVIMVVVKPIFW